MFFQSCEHQNKSELPVVRTADDIVVVPLDSDSIRSSVPQFAQAESEPTKSGSTDDDAAKTKTLTFLSAPPIPLRGASSETHNSGLIAVLQALFTNYHVCRVLLADQSTLKAWINHTNPLGTGGEVVTALAALLRLLADDAQTAKSTLGDFNCVQGQTVKHFRSVFTRFEPQFREAREHDAADLLERLLSLLHEDLNRVYRKPFVLTVDVTEEDFKTQAARVKASRQHWNRLRLRDNSVIIDLLEGQLCTSYACQNDTCKGKPCSRSFEPFTMLTLPLPQEPDAKIGLVHSLWALTKGVDVHRYCLHCQRDSVSTRSISLYRLPPVLIFRLDRFKYVRGKWSSYRVRRNCAVDFPDEINMAPYFGAQPRRQQQRASESDGGTDEMIYELTAVVEQTLNTGTVGPCRVHVKRNQHWCPDFTVRYVDAYRDCDALPIIVVAVLLVCYHLAVTACSYCFSRDYLL